MWPTLFGFATVNCHGFYYWITHLNCSRAGFPRAHFAIVFALAECRSRAALSMARADLGIFRGQSLRKSIETTVFLGHPLVMPRAKSIPDTEIFSAVTAALIASGGKAVSFGVIAKSCGLAASTLAQRFGTVDGMIRSALAAEWQALAEATEKAELDALATPKGAQNMLKALPPMAPALLAASFRDDSLRSLAEAWRLQVETALVPRLGGGSKGREQAGLVFAAWQGRQIWGGIGDKPFRFGDLLKRLG